MDNEGLASVISEKLSIAQNAYKDYDDRDEFIENVASNGNHDDTFCAGEDYGYLAGKIAAYKGILAILAYSN